MFSPQNNHFVYVRLILYYLAILFTISINVHANENMFLQTSFIWPISGTTAPDTIKSPFGFRDSSGFDWHKGIDILTTDDDNRRPIYAVNDATVFDKYDMTGF